MAAVVGDSGKPGGMTEKEEKYFFVEDLIRKEINKSNNKYSSFHKAYRAERKGFYKEGLSLTDHPIQDPWLDRYRILLRGRLFYKSGRYEEAFLQISPLLNMEKSSDLSWCQSAVNEAVILYIDILVKSENFELNSLFLEKYMGEMPFKSLIEISFLYSRLRIADKVFDTLISASAAIGEYQPESEIEDLKYYIMNNVYSRDIKEVMTIVKVLERLGWKGLADKTIAILEKKYPDDQAIQLVKGRLFIDRKKRRSALKIFKNVYADCDEESLKGEALLNIASVNYEMGRIILSARFYRDFAREYPGYKDVKPIMRKSARIFLSCGKFNDAIEMWEMARDVKSGSFAAGSLITEAVLKLWLGKKEEAYRLLERYVNLSPENKQAAFYYWLFRTANSNEDKKRWRNKLTSQFPFTYFSEISTSGKLSYLCGKKSVLCDGEKKGGSFTKEEMRDFTRDIPHSITASSAYNSFIFFIQEQNREKAGPLLKILVSDFKEERGKLLSLALALRLSGMPSLVFRIPYLQSTCSNAENLSTFRFPFAYSKSVCESSKAYGIAPEFVLAVIRQESKFDRKALSKAGAMGLMQLMPPTGLWIAEMLGIREMNQEELVDPDTNIKLGCWYINYLLKRNDQSFIGAISAYNAGMSRMADWRRRFRPRLHPLIALELIGIRETRDYVKGVLEAALIYNKLYSGREVE